MGQKTGAGVQTKMKRGWMTESDGRSATWSRNGAGVGKDTETSGGISQRGGSEYTSRSYDSGGNEGYDDLAGLVTSPTTLPAVSVDGDRPSSFVSDVARCGAAVSSAYHRLTQPAGTEAAGGRTRKERNRQVVSEALRTLNRMNRWIEKRKKVSSANAKTLRIVTQLTRSFERMKKERLKADSIRQAVRETARQLERMDRIRLYRNGPDWQRNALGTSKKRIRSGSTSGEPEGPMKVLKNGGGVHRSTTVVRANKAANITADTTIDTVSSGLGVGVDLLSSFENSSTRMWDRLMDDEDNTLGQWEAGKEMGGTADQDQDWDDGQDILVGLEDNGNRVEAGISSVTNVRTRVDVTEKAAQGHEIGQASAEEECVTPLDDDGHQMHTGADPSWLDGENEELEVEAGKDVGTNRDDSVSRQNSNFSDNDESDDGDNPHDSDYVDPETVSRIRSVEAERAQSKETKVPGFDAVSAQPALWPFVVEGITSLEEHDWVDSNTMNFWLVNEWRDQFERGKTDFVYIPTQYLLRSGDPVSETELAEYRTLFHGALSKEAMVMSILLVGDQSGTVASLNHYCCAVFYPNGDIFVLGRESSEDTFDNNAVFAWDEWGGEEVFRRVCTYRGWDFDALRPEVRVVELGWIQNGRDCGPIAVEAVMHILDRGFIVGEDGRWKRPALKCYHGIRKQIAVDCQAFLRAQVPAFMEYVERNDDDILRQRFGEGKDAMVDLGSLVNTFVIESGSLRENVLGVIRSNDRVHRRLKGPCLIRSSNVVHTNGISSAKEVHDQYGTIGKYAKKVVHFSAQDEWDVFEMAGLDDDSTMDIGGGVNPGVEEDDSDDDSDGEHVGRREQEPFVSQSDTSRMISKISLERDKSQATPSRFPRPDKPPMLPRLKTLKGLWLPHDDSFDDYETGPTIEYLNPVLQTLQPLADIDLTYFVDNVIQDAQDTYQDRGWRLPQNFLQTYTCKRPSEAMIRQHIVPPHKIHRVYEPDALPGVNRRNEPVVVQDKVEMGMQDMLNEADRVGSDDIFITGKTGLDEFVKLNLERDAVVVDQWKVSIDVDSAILNTTDPKIKEPLIFNMGPISWHRAPIDKDNKTSISCYYPQSEYDRTSMGGRSEWFRRFWKVSQCPNIEVGRMSGLGGNIKMIMVFPRMLHLNVYTKYWRNIVDRYCQMLLWNRLLLPAMNMVSDSSDSAYRIRDVSQMSKQQSAWRQFVKTFVMSPNQFEKFKRMIKFIVEQRQDLAQFKGLFWVLEVKGCKGFTKVVTSHEVEMADWIPKVVKHMQEKLSMVDWIHSCDRRYGEFFLDVGMAIHPVSVHEPVVSLWRADQLERDMGACGYTRGQLHRVNTFANVGAIQARMAPDREPHTRLTYVSGYMLHYEPFRPGDNVNLQTFAPQRLYDSGAALHQNYENYCTIASSCENGSRGSLGVRQEVRCAADCLDQVCGGLIQRASDVMTTEAVIFIPTKIYFAFCQRKMKAYYRLQLKLYHLRPPNYGTLTGLISYMMQSVVFTPPRVEKFVRDALATLRFSSIIDHFGMFFFHNLEVNEEDIFIEEEIEAEDSRETNLFYGDKPRRSRKSIPTTVDNPSGNSERPLGDQPSWKQVRRCNKSDPWLILNSDLLNDPIVQALWVRFQRSPTSPYGAAVLVFILFTNHYWNMLNPHWRRHTVDSDTPLGVFHVTTLSDALRTWTWEWIWKNVDNTLFVASNAGLLGATKGRKQEKFRDKVDTLFPQSNVELKGRWTMVEEELGYIWKFRQLYDDFEEVNQDRFRRTLSRLLGLCGCLPVTTKTSPWQLNSEEMVKFWTNPVTYRLESVGTSDTVARKRRARTLVSRGVFRTATLQLHRNMSRIEAESTLRKFDKAKKTVEKASQLKKPDPLTRKILQNPLPITLSDWAQAVPDSPLLETPKAKRGRKSKRAPSQSSSLPPRRKRRRIEENERSDSDDPETPVPTPRRNPQRLARETPKSSQPVTPSTLRRSTRKRGRPRSTSRSGGKKGT